MPMIVLIRNRGVPKSAGVERENGMAAFPKFVGIEIAPVCAIILGAVFVKLREMVPGNPVSFSFARSSKNQKLMQRRGVPYV